MTTLSENDNPQHVTNLDSIEKLEAAGFTGPDASLDISLFEYGLVWRQLDNGEYLFVYPIMQRDNQPDFQNAGFDRCTFEPQDVRKQFDWADDLDIIETSEYPQQIFDAYNQYGVENIFGMSYWEGFKIDEYKKYIDFQGDCNCVSVPQYYAANHNMCGYMPDSPDSVIYDNFDDAKRDIIDTVKDFEEEALTEEHAENFCAAAEDINLEQSPFSYIVNSHCFFVCETEPPPPEFRFAGCDCCDDRLGRDVEAVQGYNPKTQEIEDLGEICSDCLNYFANGELPQE